MILNINISLILLCATWPLAITKHVSLQEQNIDNVLLNSEIKELRHVIVKRFADDKERKVLSERIAHHANHPPLKENSEQIPVSVVYEDSPHLNTKKSKNSRPSGSRSIEQTSDKAVTAETEKQTTNKVIEVVTESNKNEVKDKLNKPLKPNKDITDVETKRSDSVQVTKKLSGDINKKENPVEDNIQIPVAIQYDSNTKGSTETHLNDSKSEHHITKNDAKIADIQVNKKVSVAKTSKSNTEQNQQQTKEETGSNENHKEEQVTADVNNRNSSDKNTEQSQTLSESSTRKSKLIRQRDPIVPIIESKNYLLAQTGEFQYSYEGGDGTKAFESGQLKEFDDERKGEAVVGGFSYKDKDGNDFMVSYTADENGYRPVGAHLPTPPPLPPAIARALLYLATKTTPEPVTKSIDED